MLLAKAINDNRFMCLKKCAISCIKKKQIITLDYTATNNVAKGGILIIYDLQNQKKE